jgi:hypothetical protein
MSTLPETREQHRAQIIDMAGWFNGIEQRTGRTLGTLLASEQREYDRRFRSIRDLESRIPKTDTPQAAQLRLLALGD